MNSYQLQGQKNAIVPMSVFWLVPQLAIVGVREAFHFPGQCGFYYQEFPVSLKSNSTAIVAMYVRVAYYIGNPVLDVVQRVIILCTVGWYGPVLIFAIITNLVWSNNPSVPFPNTAYNGSLLHRRVWSNNHLCYNYKLEICPSLL